MQKICKVLGFEHRPNSDQMNTLPDDLDSIQPVTAVVLGEFLGISDERVRQLAQTGVLTKVARGQFDFRRNVLRYIDYIREAKTNQHDPPEKGQGPSSLDDEKMKLTAAKRELAEIEVAVIRGRVHEAEAVKELWLDQALALRSKLLGLPSKAAPVVPGMQPTEALAFLTELISEALEELADYEPKRIAERTNRKRLFGDALTGDDVSVETASQIEP